MNAMGWLFYIWKAPILVAEASDSMTKGKEKLRVPGLVEK